MDRLASMVHHKPVPDSISEIRLQLISLGMLRATEAIAWTSIFPYVYFMIRSFDEVPTSRITFYAGFLIAVFTFAEFLSNMVWSRKTLLIGSVGGIITALWFGLSRSITSAVLSRAFGGLSNPNVGLVQTCAVELTTRDEQRGRKPQLTDHSYLVGPVLGGLLADPATNYPSIFPPNYICILYPYLLPNLVVAFSQISSFILAFFVLEETHPQLSAGPPDIGLRLGRSIAALLCGKRPRPGSTNTDTYGYDALDGEQQSQDIGTPTEPAQNSGSNIELQPIQREVSGKNVKDNNSTTSTDELNERAGMMSDSESSINETSKAFTPQIMLQILSVSLLAYHKMSSDAVMAPFLAAPPSTETDENPSSPSNTMSLSVRSILQTPNGFGYSNQTIGFILLSQAIVAALVQIRLVPYFIDRVGPLRAYRIVLSIYPILYLATPFLPAFPSQLPLIFVVLELWSKAYECLNRITKTISDKSYLAQVNGAAASLSCLARAMGPIITGKLFEVGEHVGYVGIAFWALGVVAVTGAAESLLLRDHVQ
ncbi:protein zinc induced facilitator-LIKE 1 [Rhypophila decipiens]